MHDYRRHPSGRRPRRARLVDVGHRARPSIQGEAAQAFLVGLDAAQLLAHHFPHFYTEHAAGMPCTPEHLLGCAAAFWQLWQIEGLQLRLPGDEGWYGDDELPFAATPEATLRAFDGVTVAFMNDMVAHFLMCPRPIYYGLGVESWLETESGPDVLTATLWRLFEGTCWAILDMGSIHSGGYNDIEPAVAEAIASLRPLPANADLVGLSRRVALPGVSSLGVDAFDLLAYAVAQTGNALADYNDYDVEAIHMGEVDLGWSWDGARALIAAQRKARAIAKAYCAWGTWVSASPHERIRAIAAALHTAHRANKPKPEDAPTLLTILADAGMLAEG